MAELAVPEGLAARGARFWSNVSEMYDLGDGERELLEEACRALDLADQLHTVVLADGPMSVGSRGQPAAHPALNQLHSVRGVLAKLLASLDFPTEAKVWRFTAMWSIRMASPTCSGTGSTSRPVRSGRGEPGTTVGPGPRSEPPLMSTPGPVQSWCGLAEPETTSDPRFMPLGGRINGRFIRSSL